MELGMIGLGRMGAAMVRRLLGAGHRCVVTDVRRDAVEELQGEGAVGVFSLEALVRQLQAPRAVWMMLPAGVVDDALERLVPLLGAGDTVIDGGNSYYHDDLGRAARLRERGLHYVDVGVSGGIWGLERGSWLLDLSAHALCRSPGLSGFTGQVSDSGEGRWTQAAAIDEGVPTPVLGSALNQRFSSRGEGDFADKLLSAMRFEFGGHLEKKGGG